MSLAARHIRTCRICCTTLTISSHSRTCRSTLRGLQNDGSVPKPRERSCAVLGIGSSRNFSKYQNSEKAKDTGGSPTNRCAPFSSFPLLLACQNSLPKVRDCIHGKVSTTRRLQRHWRSPSGNDLSFLVTHIARHLNRWAWIKTNRPITSTRGAGEG